MVSWLVLGWLHPGIAAELLVFEDKACGPCILFDRQVGHLYDKTDEAKSIPLRRVQFGAPVPESIGIKHDISVAPTFVLIDEGQEVGRFEGYTHDELFWMNLNYLINQLTNPVPAD